MSKLICLRVAALFALLVATAAHVALPAAAAERCYRDWSDAAPVVQREQLRTARDIQDAARERSGADIVRITLCQEGEDFVYRLVVRSQDGRISNMKVSAAPPDAAR